VLRSLDVDGEWDGNLYSGMGVGGGGRRVEVNTDQ